MRKQVIEWLVFLVRLLRVRVQRLEDNLEFEILLEQMKDERKERVLLEWVDKMYGRDNEAI